LLACRSRLQWLGSGSQSSAASGLVSTHLRTWALTCRDPLVGGLRAGADRDRLGIWPSVRGEHAA